MENVNDMRTGRHCVFMLQVHLIFVTRYRRDVFTNEILKDLQAIFSDVCKDFEASLEGFDGEDDHVHLLVTCPPKAAISYLVNSLKGVSGRLIRKRAYPSIRQKLWENFLWSPGYFAASCESAQLSVLKQYGEGQRTPD